LNEPDPSDPPVEDIEKSQSEAKASQEEEKKEEEGEEEAAPEEPKSSTRYGKRVLVPIPIEYDF
jgi:hypothetical protein